MRSGQDTFAPAGNAVMEIEHFKDPQGQLRVSLTTRRFVQRNGFIVREVLPPKHHARWESQGKICRTAECSEIVYRAVAI
jgi:hypothetical protein